MSQSLSLRTSARSLLIAGVSTAVVGTAVLTPVSAPELTPAKISAALSLVSVTTPLENGIKNLYNAVEPWAAYGSEVAQWGLSFIPGLWWVAPGIDLTYFSIEPLVQAGVFSFADLVGLNFAQIGPDIATGIRTAGQNFITYGLAWLNSLVPFPPIPPLPPFPGRLAASAVNPAAAGSPAGPRASSVTSPIENGIKNTYNFVEGWANYAMQWTDYVLGQVPVVNWVSPVVPLLYNTIEPLVQAGVYAFADLLGLNFAAIGPDIRTGITTAVNNAIQGVLNWINIPLPPRPPVRAAAVRAAASGGAAAAAAPVVAADSVEASTGKPAETGGGTPASDTKTVTGVAVHTGDAATPADNTGTQSQGSGSASESAAPVAVGTQDAPVAAEAPSAGETPHVRRGHIAAAAASDGTGGGASTAKADQPHRVARPAG